jgi:DNA (cytosine-5)-methyltransferase 1
MNKIADLFAGCGGMSRGFCNAGFESVIAFEKDEWAAETYASNHPNTRVFTGPIEQHDLASILTNDIDGVVGGPPCQGFSLSGNRDPSDPRNSLFMQFARSVELSSPKFFVMENVPGILSARNSNDESVKDIITNVFSDLGYEVALETLDASEHGVPQKRRRVFFIGTRKGLGINPESLYPEKGSNPVSVLEAISDLPPLDRKNRGEEKSPYTSTPYTEYQKEMRGTCNDLHNHVCMRHTERLVERFKQIKPGQSVADVAEEHSAVKRGNSKIKSGKVFSQNNFRVFGDLPCPTIPASFQSNFVHPTQDRNFTAREGARLQSFPDDYVFRGKRTLMSWEKHLSQYNQIGNAVPPLLAKAIAESIKKKFN